LKTTIFYFTGTGNCLKVARDLAKELRDTSIINIAQVINNELDLSADCIGIIYPVYEFGMPLIVTRFIKKFKGNPGKYFFAIATGGGLAADTLGQNARLFKSLGIQLSAGFFIQMPGNYTVLYGALAVEKQNKLFEKEKKRIKEIAGIIREGKQCRIKRGNFLANLIFSGLIYNLASPSIPFQDKGFWVNDKCNSCGICVRVCPVNNVRLVNGKPEWLHKCEQCFACLQWCPKEAIQYGRSTLNRKRYHNPEITLEDLVSSR
jgi:ferredoxin